MSGQHLSIGRSPVRRRDARSLSEGRTPSPCSSSSSAYDQKQSKEVLPELGNTQVLRGG